jgi:hypothetical protein
MPSSFASLRAKAMASSLLICLTDLT